MLVDFFPQCEDTMDLSRLSVGNAAGTIKRLDEVERACGKNAMTHITVGSITIKPRKGNMPDQPCGRIYYFDSSGRWSVNALGLPNIGFTAFMKILPDMTRKAHAAGKELRVSVAGESPEEYCLMAWECYLLGADSVELNLGCPNIWGADKKQKPIPSYDPTLTDSILKLMLKRLKGRKVDVKISPIDSIPLALKLATIFTNSGCVGNIVGTNTIPNQERMGFDGHPALSFNGGIRVGGLAGSELSSASYFVHDTIRKELDPSIGYIAVGGITGGTLLKHVKRGATGFQIATDYFENGGPAAFTKILEDFAAHAEHDERSLT